MVTSDAGGIVGHKLSTVVPGAVTGDGGVTHRLGNMDLAMKLHYVRGVYFFPACSTLAALSVLQLKAPMFPLLNRYYHIAARLRRSAEGRPFLKCNDSGLRIVEAGCHADLASWLHQGKEVFREKGLIPEQVIGPQLEFSPLVFIQFTRFRCGALAVSFTWSHLLGDASSASRFFVEWGELLAGRKLPKQLQPAAETEVAQSRKFTSTTETPLSIKQVHPIENYWVAPTDRKMETFSFRIADAKLMLVQSSISVGAFESLAALLWQSLAKIRPSAELKVVTICRCIPTVKTDGKLGNHQTISTLTVDSSSPKTAELSELARLIAEEAREENEAIEGWLEGESEVPDFVVYGANLTFVDMEEVDYYGLELKGQKPILVDYTIGGVGDGGAVLVRRGAGDRDRVVSVILSEGEIQSLRHELASSWGIA